MYLRHVFYALITLAMVSGITVIGPSAENRDFYMVGGAAR